MQRNFVWLKNVTHGCADGARYSGLINQSFAQSTEGIEVKPEHITELRNLGYIAEATEPVEEPGRPAPAPPAGRPEDGGGIRMAPKPAGPPEGLPQPANLRNLVR